MIGLAVAQAFHRAGLPHLLLRSGAAEIRKPRRRSARRRWRSPNCSKTADIVSLHVPLLRFDQGLDRRARARAHESPARC